MRQAILTKYLAPTATKGARVKAWCARGSVTVNWDHGLDGEHNHINACEALRDKMEWRYRPMPCHGGALPDGSGYCFVQVERGE